MLSKHFFYFRVFQHPFFNHLLSTAWNDRDELRAVPPGEVNDASRLNQTAVADIVDVPIDLDRAEEQLAELRVQFEAAVAELREAIRQWHAAHKQLALQLA